MRFQIAMYKTTLMKKSHTTNDAVQESIKRQVIPSSSEFIFKEKFVQVVRIEIHYNT